MKILVIIGFIVAFLLTALAITAHAEPYLDLSVGGSLWRDCSNNDPIEASCDVEPAGSLAGGYQWDYVALEGEISARGATTHNVKDPNTNIGRGDEQGYVLAAMVNVWPGYEIGDWRFYGGRGIGLGRAKLAGESDLVLALQGGPGFQYRVTEALSVGLGYRYLILSETDNGARYDSHTIGVGLRWSFGGGE